MGGWTTIKLKNASSRNVAIQDTRLELHGVPKKYRFEGLYETEVEYEWYKAGKGAFPEHLFPKDKINSLDEFRVYWKDLGLLFAPTAGTLGFDCYFGRTSKRAMNAIGRYIVANIDEIDSYSGSFTTFMERGMTKAGREVVEKSDIKVPY